MRFSRTLTLASTAASSDRLWLPGLPHVLAAGLIWPVFGSSAFLSGLLLASLASFVVYLPLTALALNKGEPIAEGAAAPGLTGTAHFALLALWTATAWFGAWLSILAR
jgi:hypothetical protein